MKKKVNYELNIKFIGGKLLNSLSFTVDLVVISVYILFLVLVKNDVQRCSETTFPYFSEFFEEALLCAITIAFAGFFLQSLM
jgi:hypothetical protein